jgi:hypothetical protein
MIVPGNYEDLIEKCAKQDEELKLRYHLGMSWYDIITDNINGYYNRRAEITKRRGDA